VKKQHNESMRKGQVLVVVLLVLAVVVTVALSIASRSAVDLGVTTTQDESARALEAAEVGLERYLGEVPFPTIVENVGGGGSVAEMNADYFVPDAVQLGGSRYFQINEIGDGEVRTVELPGGPMAFSNMRLCWGRIDAATDPRIEVTVYYQYGSDVYAKGKAYDPRTPARDGFVGASSAANACGTGTSYPYNVYLSSFNNDTGPRLAIPLSDVTTLFVRIRMISGGNGPQPLAVQLGGGNGANFPFQGGVVESVGRSGESVQKVKATVYQYDLPSVFDNALFSGGGIVKN
jgi:hypothetical protein